VKEADSVIPFLLGGIHNTLRTKGELMQIVNIQPMIPDTLTITFKSGLRLKVQITELPAESETT
jgi:hypothetical protein